MNSTRSLNFKGRLQSLRVAFGEVFSDVGSVGYRNIIAFVKTRGKIVFRLPVYGGACTGTFAFTHDRSVYGHVIARSNRYRISVKKTFEAALFARNGLLLSVDGYVYGFVGIPSGEAKYAANSNGKYNNACDYFVAE